LSYTRTAEKGNGCAPVVNRPIDRPGRDRAWEGVACQACRCQDRSAVVASCAVRFTPAR